MWENLETMRAAGGQRVGVDRTEKRVYGAIVAELGPFRSGRGQFDSRSLGRVVELMRGMGGVPAFWTHSQHGEDRLGNFLGRFYNPRIAGGRAVVADLYLSEAASFSPRGNLANYILELASTDPAALSLSLTLAADKIQQRVGPPIWLPIEIESIDVVTQGDATSSLLPLHAQPRTAEPFLALSAQMWGWETTSH